MNISKKKNQLVWYPLLFIDVTLPAGAHATAHEGASLPLPWRGDGEGSSKAELPRGPECGSPGEASN